MLLGGLTFDITIGTARNGYQPDVLFIVTVRLSARLSFD